RRLPCCPTRRSSDLSEDRASTLRFAHGELSLYAATLEGLLATFRGVHPEVKLRVSSQSDAEIYRALRERTVDVACVLLARYPVRSEEHTSQLQSPDH